MLSNVSAWLLSTTQVAIQIATLQIINQVSVINLIIVVYRIEYVLFNLTVIDLGLTYIPRKHHKRATTFKSKFLVRSYSI